MNLGFNNIVKKNISEDFNFNDLVKNKVYDTYDDFKLFDQFYERLRLDCYSYFKKIFLNINDYNIDLTKSDNSVNISIHQNLLVLDTLESTFKYPINNIIGSLSISQGCENIKTFDENFPKIITTRLSIYNHIDSYKNCPNCGALIIYDKQLTDFDFDEIQHLVNTRYVWFYVSDENVIKNFKNVQKFLDNHSYTILTVTTDKDLNLLSLWNLDGKYYTQFTEKTMEGQYRITIDHIKSEAYDITKMNEIDEAVQFDKLTCDHIVTDNVVLSMYKQKVKNELKTALNKHYFSLLHNSDGYTVEIKESRHPDFTFDIIQSYRVLESKEIGSVVINHSGIVERFVMCYSLNHTKNPNTNVIEPEISSFIYALLTTDLYFNEVCISDSSSNLHFIFDSMSMFIPQDIQCNFPFDLLKKKINKVIFGYWSDVHVDPHNNTDDFRIDSRSTTTLTFGYGELHFKPSQKEHQKEIGYGEKYDEFWDVVTNVFDVDPQYGIHFVKNFEEVNEDFDFNKAQINKTDYGVLIHNVSAMDDILKKFEFINQSFIANNDLELFVKGYDVVDQHGNKIFSITFANEFHRIENITFYTYDKQEYYGYSMTYNIFGHLCFLAELKDYLIINVLFYQDRKNGVVPYIMHNDFFDDIEGDNSIEDIIANVASFREKNILSAKEDAWYTQIQRLYPVSNKLRHVTSFNLYSYDAELIIDDSVAFANKLDFTDFKNKFPKQNIITTNYTTVHKQ